MRSKGGASKPRTIPNTQMPTVEQMSGFQNTLRNLNGSLNIPLNMRVISVAE